MFILSLFSLAAIAPPVFCLFLFTYTISSDTFRRDSFSDLLQQKYLLYKLRGKYILSSLIQYAHLTQLNILCRNNAVKPKFFRQIKDTIDHLWLFILKFYVAYSSHNVSLKYWF